MTPETRGCLDQLRLHKGQKCPGKTEGLQRSWHQGDARCPVKEADCFVIWGSIKENNDSDSVAHWPSSSTSIFLSPSC